MAACRLNESIDIVALGIECCHQAANPNLPTVVVELEAVGVQGVSQFGRKSREQHVAGGGVGKLGARDITESRM